tara:strand:- start:275 stop:562 length:288 start_codon:yes stop_codon:yes gene_type:complete
MHNKFNAHAIWHITVSWAAFNTVNLSNQYLCIKDNKVYKIVEPFRLLNSVLFRINITNKRADLDDQATMIDLEQLMLLDDTISKQRHHRRVQSHS